MDHVSYSLISLLPHILVTVSSNYPKKQRNQQPGSEGHRKESACKLLDGIEFSKQYNNTSDGSPLHSYQMRVNSKKGYIDLGVLFVFKSSNSLFIGYLKLSDKRCVFYR